MIKWMKVHFHLAGLLLASVIAVPALAQRSTAPPASLLTGGTHMPPASASILDPGFGQVDRGGRGMHVSGPIVRGGNSWSYTPHRDHHDRDQGGRNYRTPYYGGYYYPYYGYDYGYSAPVVIQDNSSLPGAGTFDSGQNNVESQSPDAPTVFENRRPSEYFYRPQAGANSVLDERNSRYGERYTDGREAASPEPQPHGVVTANGNENNDTTTVLIFKDGVQREVTNYAIMGQYIFVFSGDRRKIPLSELNIDATKKANEDRGNEFKIPGLANPS